MARPSIGVAYFMAHHISDSPSSIVRWRSVSNSPASAGCLVHLLSRSKSLSRTGNWRPSTLPSSQQAADDQKHHHAWTLLVGGAYERIETHRRRSKVDL